MHGQKCRVALARRIAKPAPWAVVTVGFARVAQRGAQLHQSLIVIAGTVRGDIGRHQIADAALNNRSAHILTYAVKA